jgi:hypothetical protein
LLVQARIIAENHLLRRGGALMVGARANQWRDEMIKRRVARYNWQAGIGRLIRR